MGNRAGLDGCEKSRPHRDSISEPVKAVASRYTEYATPAHVSFLIREFKFNVHVNTHEIIV